MSFATIGPFQRFVSPATRIEAGLSHSRLGTKKNPPCPARSTYISLNGSMPVPVSMPMPWLSTGSCSKLHHTASSEHARFSAVWSGVLPSARRVIRVSSSSLLTYGEPQVKPSSFVTSGPALLLEINPRRASFRLCFSTPHFPPGYLSQARCLKRQVNPPPSRLIPLLAFLSSLAFPSPSTM